MKCYRCLYKARTEVNDAIVIMHGFSICGPCIKPFNDDWLRAQKRRLPVERMA